MKTLERDGVRLVYYESGVGAPPLIFIHGWCCDHSYFAPQIDHFSRDHRVLAVDLRGHGASDKPASSYALSAFAEDVAAVCDHAETGPAVVVGHSMGGRVGLALAWQRPDLVAKLVLVDSPVYLQEHLLPLVGQVIEGLQSPAYSDVARGFVTNAMFLPTSDPALVERIASGMSGAPQHVMLQAFVGIAEDPTPAARSARMPVLSIDAANPLNDNSRLRDAMPQVRTAQVSDAGHFCQLERPATVNRLIEDFVHA